jgi:hypothetical protein
LLPSVRGKAAMNHRTPAGAFPALADNLGRYGWSRVVFNPSATPDILERLLSAGAGESNVAKHPNATPEMLDRLSRYEHFRVREAVAANEKTQLEALARGSCSTSMQWQKRRLETPILRLSRWSGHLCEGCRLYCGQSCRLSPPRHSRGPSDRCGPPGSMGQGGRVRQSENTARVSRQIGGRSGTSSSVKYRRKPVAWRCRPARRWRSQVRRWPLGPRWV